MDEDEARIAAAFRGAAAEVPPAGFDAGDVAAASRRITRRRRSAMAGAALAVLAVVGVGVTVGVAGSGPQGAPSAAGAATGDATSTGGVTAEAAPEARAAAPQAAAPPVAPGSGAAVVPGPPAASGAPVGPPLGPGTGECADRQDPALRALVDQALPEVVGAPQAMTTQECRPGAQRGVALEVHDGRSAGVLSVTYLPPGTAADSVSAPEDARAVPTASGGTVLVGTLPARSGDPEPFAARLAAVAAYLAPRL